MYGNGMQGPFMMPNIGMGYGNMMGGAPMFARGISMSPPPSGGLRSLFGLAPRAGSAGGILSGLRSFNWSGMLSNASRALGVVNQAIPVVKQIGPMMNNMKSMLKIASVFKDETDTSSPSRSTVNSSEKASDITSESKEDNSVTKAIKTNNNEPNFFL